MFETPIKLHYSQTRADAGRNLARFETPIKLHYSQTFFMFFGTKGSV